MTDLSEKVQIAIDRFRAFEPKEGYFLCFSGGKDSIVIRHLADLAGVQYDAHYSHTTVDPPELVRFIKEYHSDVNVVMPSTTMWNLIVKRRMPPTRMARYCCDVLKEGLGKGRFVVTGVRWAESSRRKNNRNMVETNFGSRSKKEDVVIKLNSDNDEARRMVEHCQMKTKHVLNPIIDWEDSDVWDFIHYYKLPYCSLYDEGLTRLGCVGCPLQSSKGMVRDFERWPKYKEAYIRAFDRMLKARDEAGLATDGWKTAQDVYDWWIQKPKDKEVVEND